MNQRRCKFKYNGFETLALHAGYTPDKETNARAIPIYQTTSYLFNNTEHAADLFSLKENGNIYTRISNPTTDVLEKRVTALEGGVGALALSSGQSAATYSILNILKAGDEFISSENLYGGTHQLFQNTFKTFGIKVNFVNPLDPDNFKKALNSKVKAIFAESCGNPKLDILEIEKIADIAHNAGIPLIIDNTVLTPYLFRPFEYGADIVIHSLTKFLGGHGTSIGGIIVDSGNFKWDNGNFPQFTEPDAGYNGIKFYEAFSQPQNISYITRARVILLRDFGSCISPFNSHQIIQGIETLALRMERHCENAYKIAKFLAQHDNVSWVNYPGLENHPRYSISKNYLKKGFGALIGFGVKGGYEKAKQFINNVKLLSHLANIGDAKSLVIHPASTTHQQLSMEAQIKAGVTPDFIRLSVGLESIDDLMQDINQALNPF